MPSRKRNKARERRAKKSMGEKELTLGDKWDGPKLVAWVKRNYSDPILTEETFRREFQERLRRISNKDFSNVITILETKCPESICENDGVMIHINMDNMTPSVFIEIGDYIKTCKVLEEKRKWRDWATLGEIQVRKCNHGFDQLTLSDNDHPVSKFMDSFFDGFNDVSPMANIRRVLEEQPEAMYDEHNKTMAVNILKNIGTNVLLSNRRGAPDISGYSAFALLVLEQYDESTDIDSITWNPAFASKSDILLKGNRRDMLKFFQKRITCSCLSEMYSQSRKELPKVGKCCHCKKVKERSELMVCSRCRVETFCSDECHIAHWPIHKEECKLHVRVENERKRFSALMDVGKDLPPDERVRQLVEAILPPHLRTPDQNDIANNVFLQDFYSSLDNP